MSFSKQLPAKAASSTAVLLICASAAAAQTTPDSEARLPPAVVVIVGDSERLPTIGGAGQVIDAKELSASRVFTVNEALRKVPGVNARDEEGFGLRPNIGIRGLNPTRSTKITLLEDGIALAYAPYGDNASYYHPQVDRYSSIEVLKGASSLLFGPQTVAGIVNYLTPQPPREFSGAVQATFGNRDYRNAKLSLGGNGLLLDYTRKQGDGARDNLSHALDDLNFKYVADLGTRQALTLRASLHREDSTVTYSGLTQAEFDQLGARYNPFKNDRFTTRRTGVSATHELDLDGGALLLTNVYFAKFERDWWRQASNSQDSQCGADFNAARLAGSAVDADTCNSVQGRLRTYYQSGIEPRLTLPHALGEFQAGVKAHVERQERVQINGSTPTARSGTTAEDTRRRSDAYAFFVANRFDLGDFSITPILRYEHIGAERSNRQNGESGSTSLAKAMPGISVNWNPSRTLTVFGSLHKGFAPPRVEDLIGGSGTVTEVDAEQSTNLEVGVRSQPVAGVALQAALFRSDFSNLIAAGSIAGGSTPLSQGEALFQGLELGAQAEMKNGIFGRLAATWLPTAEQTSAFRNVANQAVVGVAGNRQPYAPKQTLTAALGYAVGALRAEMEAQHVGRQFADFANTVAPSADGQRGELAAYTVLNAAVNYRFDEHLSAFVTAKNLADKTYIVDRTRGIQVGMPRLVQAGLRYAF